MNKFGEFGQEMAYLGGEYIENNEMKPTEREKGKQFLSGTAHGNEFSHFISLAAEEPYTDDFERTKRDARAAKEKLSSSTAFKPCSPSKRMTGSGDVTGLFSRPSIPDDPYQPKSPMSAKKEPRNFSCSPPRRGQGGVPGTLLSPYPKHRPDVYESEKLAAKADERKAREKRNGPIRVGKPPSTISPPIFNPEPITRPKQYQPDTKITKPFRPGSPSRRGIEGTFSSYPEHIPDPYDERMRKAKSMERGATTDGMKPAPFRSSFARRSSPVRSIHFRK
ncbi:Protein of unknown function DUF4586 [Carpediemonas membranifera]|uniref:Cilia-and flagella-associated protein 96 n=1 Tax=Carpediemonas membranifera TaxID=201153 RepID=A0A8J6E0V1_9EUKA|nr:Protein of unknown function DUF4586 [Carpediemonas membranifera]|eukprot:KAG9392678.1 Protein of unknown function DUF4586 [Carpediemonas membranifera]